MDSTLDAILSDLIDKKVPEMEVPFQGDHLYKFYSPGRRSFFKEPTIRYTVKSGLNDPFELSPRWKSLISDDTMLKVANYMEVYTTKRLEDADYLIGRMIDSGKVPADMTIRNFKRTMKTRMRGVEGAEIRRRIVDEFSATIPSQLLLMREGWSSALNEFISSTGIFSVTEDPLSDQLWALYADCGRGFVVELNCRHKFFMNASRNISVFKKVVYSDLKSDEFFKNPYYLFLVKNAKWSFENEWRAIKNVAECDFKSGEDVHIWKLPTGAISSVIFGYNYPESTVSEDISSMLDFDKNINVRRAFVDESLSRISIVDVS